MRSRLDEADEFKSHNDLKPKKYCKYFYNYLKTPQDSQYSNKVLIILSTLDNYAISSTSNFLLILVNFF